MGYSRSPLADQVLHTIKKKAKKLKRKRASQMEDTHIDSTGEAGARIAEGNGLPPIYRHIGFANINASSQPNILPSNEMGAMTSTLTESTTPVASPTNTSTDAVDGAKTPSPVSNLAQDTIVISSQDS